MLVSRSRDSSACKVDVQGLNHRVSRVDLCCARCVAERDVAEVRVE